MITSEEGAKSARRAPTGPQCIVSWPIVLLHRVKDRALFDGAIVHSFLNSFLFNARPYS